jgi:hypothetical protein
MALETSHTYLARLQQAAYARMGVSPPTFNPDELHSREAAWTDEFLPSLDRQLEEDGIDTLTRRVVLDRFRLTNTQGDLEELRVAARNSPTPYVNPYDHQRLTILDGRIANLGRRRPQLNFASELQKLCGRVTVSTLPMGQVNARALRVPGTDEYLIVFDPVLFSFIEHVSIAVAEAIDWEKALESARRHTEAAEAVDLSDVDLSIASRHDHPEVARRFFHTMFCFLHRGMPPFPQRYGKEFRGAVQLLRWNATLFILAHEYVHLLLGHPLTSDAPYTPEQELEADWLACSILNADLESRGNNPLTRFIGPYFFFVAAMLADLGLGAIRTGNTRLLSDLIPRDAIELGEVSRSTHPIVPRRMRTLDQWLRENFPPRGVRSNEYFATLLVDVAANLWATVQPAVLNLRAKGLQAPALWNSFDIFEGAKLEAPTTRPAPSETGALPIPPAGGAPRCPRCGWKVEMGKYAAAQTLHLTSLETSVNGAPLCF